MFISSVSILLLIIYQGECAMRATAVLYKANSMTSCGTLTFTQENANSPVHITGTLAGLNASRIHGFHVHTNAVSDGSPDCDAAGPHFNPYSTRHGFPTADIGNRHVGDLGNIITDASGNVNIDIKDSIIQLYNATQSILDRTAIVHVFRDDGGAGGFSDSATTGNAGARIVCGLIKSNAFNIKPTISILFMVMIIVFMN